MHVNIHVNANYINETVIGSGNSLNIVIIGTDWCIIKGLLNTLVFLGLREQWLP